MIKFIVGYFFIGVLFCIFIDMILYIYQYRNKKLPIDYKDWGKTERLLCMCVWPLALLTFSEAFWSAYFNRKK